MPEIWNSYVDSHKYDKKCKNTQKIARNLVGGGPGMTTWFYRGVGQITMFDHEGEGGQNSRKSDHVVYGCPL